LAALEVGLRRLDDQLVRDDLIAPLDANSHGAVRGVLAEVGQGDEGDTSNLRSDVSACDTRQGQGDATFFETTLAREGDGLRIERPGDAIRTLARPLGEGSEDKIDGIYRSEELGSELEIVNAGGSWLGGFRGSLGQGPLMPMAPAGAGVWRLTCHRSLDAPAPGDWTVRVADDPSGARSLRVGCWLARDVLFLA
jgi:D-aminopeptidase